MYRHLYILLLSCFLLTGCHQEQTTSVSADFTATVEDDNYSVPVRVLLENKTTGADHYRWTFEGGEPATSNKRQPDPVMYRQAGTCTIRLEAWNDDERKVKEFILLLDAAVTVGFDAELLVNAIAPVQVRITNTTVGAGACRWTFEGGQPAASNESTPPPVTFGEGTHTIRLEASNSRKTFTHTKTITVLPAMSLDFDITPSFENEDMEAPLTATLDNKSISGVSYRWTASGGTIANDTAAHQTTIHFASAGNYTISLQADNGKEEKTVSKSITVKSNSNLYTMTDVKLGIKSAHATIGSFYSCALRKVISKDEVSESNASSVDFAFFGLNGEFRYCRILSPDSVDYYAFQAIPNAQHTAVINLLENSPVSFSVADFDSMTSDALLHSLPIALNDSKDAYFTGAAVPRIVLFQTADGRKGAIKIKAFVSNGLQSYILADIKVQKSP